MAETIAYLCTPILLLVITLWLCFPRTATNAPIEETPIQDTLKIDEDFLHDAECRLTEYDAMLRRIKAERRETAIAYLDQVRGDYLRVERLLSRSAKFLPEITVAGEAARVFLGIKFRLQCVLARLEIRIGFLPAADLRGLTVKLRLAAIWATHALNEVSREHGLPVLESDLRSGR